MAVVNWSNVFEGKTVDIRLYHNPWKNLRQVWVDDELVMENKVKGISDVGSVHEINICGHKCVISILPQPNIFKNWGYEYDLIVDGQSQSGKQTDVYKLKSKIHEVKVENKATILGLTFGLLVILSIILIAVFFNSELGSILIIFLAGLAFIAVMFVDSFKGVASYRFRALYSITVSVFTIITYLLVIDSFTVNAYLSAPIFMTIAYSYIAVLKKMFRIS